MSKINKVLLNIHKKFDRHYSTLVRRQIVKVLNWLKLPETRNIHDLDSPSTTLLHAKIIRSKPFLKKLYSDLYCEFKKSILDYETKLLVEVGSGGGFIKDVIPNVITSDVVKLSGIDKQFSALNMPFSDNTVDAFFMLMCFHHVNEPVVFFKEMDRCLKIGGKIIMHEPANTLLNRFYNKSAHSYEKFDLYGNWGFDIGGRLSTANLALPWIVFYRDRKRFEKEFPTLKIRKLQIHTPFRYLISGGTIIRQLSPSCTYNIIKGFETILSPLNKYIGMFLTVELEKIF